MADVQLARNQWIKEICRYAYVLIKQLATDYKRNQACWPQSKEVLEAALA